MSKQQKSKNVENQNKLAMYDKILREFENQYGLAIRSARQGSEVWLQTKLGVISASNAHKAVAAKGTAKRQDYLCELVAEVCTGVIEELNFKQTEWGKQHEDAARSRFEFSTNQHMTPLAFVFKDLSFRVGCSPDGVILGTNKPAEIKCPWDSTNYVKFLLGGIQKPEWQWQNQMTMWVMGADEMDVMQFDPRMKTTPTHTILVKKNPEMQKKLTDSIPELVLDMDKMLKEVGVEFGDQWLRISGKKNDAA
jgi:hypothetical protein